MAAPKNPHVPPPTVFAGDVFGRLTVVAYVRQDERKKRKYLCRCSCGREVTIRGDALLSGTSKSCGCLRRDEQALRARLPDRIALFRLVLKRYQNGAKKRGLAFNLDEAAIRRLIVQPCFYCGREWSNTAARDGQTLSYNGIDRIDNNVGYQEDNVVPCCKTCNLAKGALTQAHFLEWGIRLADYQTRKQKEQDVQEENQSVERYGV